MQELEVFTCPLEGVSHIEASAGTGKTWTICALYVRLLLEKGLSVDAILVVTFTRAATAELQSRIRARLTQVLHALNDVKAREGATGIPHESTGDAFIDALLTQVVGVRVSYEEARLRVEQGIQSFDQAAICTIHGFCQRALQEMPFSAMQPFEWTLSEEDEALRLEEALAFWRRYVEPAAEHYPGFCTWLLTQGASLQSLDQELKKRLRKPLAEVKFPSLDTVGTELTSLLEHSLALQSDLADSFKQARALWQQEETTLFALLNDALPDLHGRFYTPHTLKKAQAAWAQFFAQSTPYTAPEVKSTLLSSTVLASYTKKNKPVPQHPFFTQADALQTKLRILEATYAKAWLSVLRIWLIEGPKALEMRKQTQGLISFDGLLNTLHQVLQTQPDLIRALRLRYHAALIDEFQDTDPVQWSIFQTIFVKTEKQETAFDSIQTLEPIENSPLFLVGDPKQAIYSFRSADLYTYLAARDSAQACYTLGTNQRSTEALVTACNQLFTRHPEAFIQEGLSYQAVKAGAAQRLGQSTEAGLWVWMLPEEPLLSKQLAMQAAAHASAAQIAQLLTVGDPALPRLTPNNIAVLVKTHAQGHFMKQVLAQWGIASVEMTQACVLNSRTAQELEYVMRAIYAPQNIKSVRAALSLDWFGLDANTLTPSVDAAATWIERFLRYKTLWEKKGWALMWRTLTQELGILPRIAADQDGDRRLTDLAHINELIVMHAAHSLRGKSTLSAVMRWFIKERYAAHNDPDQTQLRLESDRECVQILTIHRAKGLEYDVVFCPFLNEGSLRARSSMGRLPQAREYHDETGQAVLDYRFAACGSDASADLPEESVIEAAQLEAMGAEAARLIYVALTRAVYRCYIVGGLYTSGQGSGTKEARQSVLNWLVAGPEELTHFYAWMKKPPEAKTILDAWQTLSSKAITLVDIPHPHIDEMERMSEKLAEALRQHTPCATPSAQHAQRLLYGAGEVGKITSFSKLTQNLPFTPAEHADSTAADKALEPQFDVSVDEDDILYFPRGAAAGECLHRLFELADFAQPSGWPGCIQRALSGPFSSLFHRGTSEQTSKHWPAMMMRVLQDVTHTPLEWVAPDFTIAKLTPSQQRTEFEFLFPATINAAKLAPIFEHHGYEDLDDLVDSMVFDFAGASVSDASARVAGESSLYPGYVRGFIDLVFEYAGRFWIIDWKSNDLGREPGNYTHAALRRAMIAHRYHVQAGLYTLALHRYLKHTVPNYRYETHFGGYLYIFVRGMRPTWKYDEQVCGVYADTPHPNFIEALDQALS